MHNFSDECGGYIRDIMQKTQKIPLAAYVLSSEDMEFRKLFSSLEASWPGVFTADSVSIVIILNLAPDVNLNSADSVLILIEN
jgi:hypothetical protein